MAIKPIRYTSHAEIAIAERGLAKLWIERTAREPEWQEQDRFEITIERRFRSVPERDGRILRAVCVETREEIRILSAFLDRRARKPR